MRNLVYKLADGTIVKTYEEAKGKDYKVVLETIRPLNTTITPKRKALLEQYGYVPIRS